MKRWIGGVLALVGALLFSVALAQGDAASADWAANPVVQYIGLLAVTGIPAALMVTEYFRNAIDDARGRTAGDLHPNAVRALGIVCGIAVAGAYALLKMLNAPVLESYPMWFRIVAIGAVFGVSAGGAKGILNRLGSSTKTKQAT
jgi:peptidoglycan/LPS O-acetylase OafA/YrhL